MTDSEEKKYVDVDSEAAEILPREKRREGVKIINEMHRVVEKIKKENEYDSLEELEELIGSNEKLDILFEKWCNL